MRNQNSRLRLTLVWLAVIVATLALSGSSEARPKVLMNACACRCRAETPTHVWDQYGDVYTSGSCSGANGGACSVNLGGGVYWAGKLYNCAFGGKVWVRTWQTPEGLVVGGRALFQRPPFRPLRPQVQRPQVRPKVQ